MKYIDLDERKQGRLKMERVTHDVTTGVYGRLEAIVNKAQPELHKIEEWEALFDVTKQSDEIIENISDMAKKNNKQLEESVEKIEKVIDGKEVNVDASENIYNRMSEVNKKNIMLMTKNHDKKISLVRLATINAKLPVIRLSLIRQLEDIQGYTFKSEDGTHYISKHSNGEIDLLIDTVNSIDNTLVDITKANYITELPFKLFNSLYGMMSFTLSKKDLISVNKSYSKRLFNERMEYAISQGAKPVGGLVNLDYKKILLRKVYSYMNTHTSDLTNLFGHEIEVEGEDIKACAMIVTTAICKMYHQFILDAKKNSRKFDELICNNVCVNYKDIVKNHKMLETNFINATVGYTSDDTIGKLVALMSKDIDSYYFEPKYNKEQ